ncbi:MAG: hypothetical protein ACJ763_09635 [Bdellovibrionia bacterium]
MHKYSIWVIASTVLSMIGVLAFSLYSGPLLAVGGYYACYYDGSDRCGYVRDQYGETYEGFSSYAACDRYCAY